MCFVLQRSRLFPEIQFHLFIVSVHNDSFVLERYSKNRCFAQFLVCFDLSVSPSHVFLKPTTVTDLLSSSLKENPNDREPAIFCTKVTIFPDLWHYLY